MNGKNWGSRTRGNEGEVSVEEEDGDKERLKEKEE